VENRPFLAQHLIKMASFRKYFTDSFTEREPGHPGPYSCCRHRLPTDADANPRGARAGPLFDNSASKAYVYMYRNKTPAVRKGGVMGCFSPYYIKNATPINHL
jgi:hypothetical protein